MRDGKAAFVIVKTGIAGERYLEVLDGLKEGDQVITGPFESVRGMYEGDLVKTAPAARSQRRDNSVMAQLFESVMLALASIWANKLRSMLTLLGNIVAVSSIITVVALITGVNEAVSDAIVSDLGADSFTIQRMGVTQNEDDFERMRNNPLVTLEDADAVKRFATSVSVGHGAGADGDARWPIATRSSRRCRCRASARSISTSRRSTPSAAA